MRMSKCLFVSIIFISVLTAVSAEVPAKKGKRAAGLKSDWGTYSEVRGETVFIGKGNAYLSIDKNEIYCDEIEVFYSKDSNGNDMVERAVFHKSIRIFKEEEEVQIGGEYAEYFKKEKKFIIRDNTFYTDAKNEVAVFGDTIYNYEEEKVTIIQGNARIYQKDIFAKGAFVKYTKRDKLMSISGFPIVRNQGSEYSARKIIVDIDKNTFILQGDLEAEIINDEKDASDDRSKTLPPQKKDDKSEKAAPPPDVKDKKAPVKGEGT